MQHPNASSVITEEAMVDVQVENHEGSNCFKHALMKQGPEINLANECGADLLNKEESENREYEGPILTAVNRGSFISYESCQERIACSRKAMYNTLVPNPFDTLVTYQGCVINICHGIKVPYKFATCY